MITDFDTNSIHYAYWNQVLEAIQSQIMKNVLHKSIKFQRVPDRRNILFTL